MKTCHENPSSTDNKYYHWLCRPSYKKYGYNILLYAVYLFDVVLNETASLFLRT